MGIIIHNIINNKRTMVSAGPLRKISEKKIQEKKRVLYFFATNSKNPSRENGLIINRIRGSILTCSFK